LKRSERFFLVLAPALKRTKLSFLALLPRLVGL